jgi:hypothetical protein
MIKHILLHFCFLLGLFGGIFGYKRSTKWGREEGRREGEVVWRESGCVGLTDLASLWEIPPTKECLEEKTCHDGILLRLFFFLLFQFFSSLSPHLQHPEKQSGTGNTHPHATTANSTSFREMNSLGLECTSNILVMPY